VVASKVTDLQFCFSTAAMLNDPFELSPVYSDIATDEDVLGTILGNPDTFSAFYAKVRFELGSLSPHLSSQEEFENHLSSNPQDVMNYLSSRAIAKIRSDLRDNIDDFKRNRFTSLQNDLGLLCLSETKRSLLMWAHYATNHGGAVIGIDTTHPWFGAGMNYEFGQLHKLIYKQERPVLPSMMKQDFESTFLRKSLEWSYEQEWRAIRHLGDQTPNNAGRYLIEFPADCLSSVTFGYRMPPSQRDKIVGKIQAKADLSHVIIEAAELDANRFGLNFTRIR
jgi:hypothetical protein